MTLVLSTTRELQKTSVFLQCGMDVGVGEGNRTLKQFAPLPSSTLRPTARWPGGGGKVRQLTEAFPPSSKRGPWRHVSRKPGRLKWYRRELATERQHEGRRRFRDNE